MDFCFSKIWCFFAKCKFRCQTNCCQFQHSQKPHFLSFFTKLIQTGKAFFALKRWTKSLQKRLKNKDPKLSWKAKNCVLIDIFKLKNHRSICFNRIFKLKKNNQKKCGPEGLKNVSKINNQLADQKIPTTQLRNLQNALKKRIKCAKTLQKAD